MIAEKATEVSQLSKRARYLLERSRVVERDERVGHVLDRLRNLGRVGLIGGAVRDMVYSTSRRFMSDLDFVVEVVDRQAYRALTEEFCALPNRFGGYRIALNGIHLDFWDAKQTWASAEGHVHVDTLEDVLKTTFFNIDAIIYVLDEHCIKMQNGTREALDNRFLDINLHPNPNPLGAAVRALRRMCQFEMSASEKLARFVAEQMDAHGWDKAVVTERKAYPYSNTLQNVAACPRNGDEFLDIMAQNMYRLPLIRQLELPF